jgi:hypothetical protein
LDRGTETNDIAELRRKEQTLAASIPDSNRWQEIHRHEVSDCFHVPAPKTEHHGDDGDRVVPLFPEVRKYLWELHELTDDGEIYVLPISRNTTNVLPTLHRIIKRVGLNVWPKAWQNMRATRATELENEFGIHKSTQWSGTGQNPPTYGIGWGSVFRPVPFRTGVL